MILAIPRGGVQVGFQVDKISDETVILEIPEFFYAVAQVYMNWYDVPDDEVIEIIEKWGNQEQNFPRPPRGL